MNKRNIITFVCVLCVIYSSNAQNMNYKRCWNFAPLLQNHCVEDGEEKLFNDPYLNLECSSKNDINRVEESGNYYWIKNNINSRIDKIRLQYILGYNNGFVAKNYYGKIGVYDLNLDPFIPFQYDHIVPYVNYRTKEELSHQFGWFVRKNEKWGYINKNGKSTIKPKYERIHIINDTTFIAYHKEQLILINSLTHKKTKLGKTCFIIKQDFNPCLFTIDDEKMGIMTFDGKSLFPPTFTDIEVLTDEQEYLTENVCYYRVKKGDSYGLVDSKGNWIIKPEYKNIKILRCWIIGEMKYMRFVVLESQEKSFLFYNGKILNISAQSYLEYSNDKKLSLIQFKENDLYGLYDYIEEKVLFSPMYDNLKWQYGTTNIIVRKNKLFGLANLKGEIIIPINYQELKSFSKELLLFNKNNKFGLIDSNNKIIIPCLYDKISVYNDSLYKTKLESRYGLITKNGKTVLDAKYDELTKLRPVDLTLPIVKFQLNGKYGYLNRNYKIQVEAKYHKVNEFRNDLNLVMANYKWGFINTKGEEVIPLIYDTAKPFYSGKAKVTINDKTFYINTKGECIQDCL